MYDFPLIWGKIRDYVTVTVAAVAAISSIGWYVTDLKLDAERLARKNDKTEFEKAQKEAETAHLIEKAKKEKAYDELKEKGDRDYSALLSKYNSAILHYKSNRNTAGNPDLSRTSPSPSSPEGATEDSLVLVRESDLLICAENTAKVVVMYDWIKNIESLNKEKEN